VLPINDKGEREQAKMCPGRRGSKKQGQGVSKMGGKSETRGREKGTGGFTDVGQISALLIGVNKSVSQVKPKERVKQLLMRPSQVPQKKGFPVTREGGG